MIIPEPFFVVDSKRGPIVFITGFPEHTLEVMFTANLFHRTVSQPGQQVNNGHAFFDLACFQYLIPII